MEEEKEGRGDLRLTMVIPPEYEKCPDCGNDLHQFRSGDMVLVCDNKHFWVPPAFANEPQRLKRATVDSNPLTGIYFGA